MNVELFRAKESLVKISSLGAPFDHLRNGVKRRLKQYYNAVYIYQSKRLSIMARESSVQLVLQNALILYEYFHPPILELYYKD